MKNTYYLISRKQKLLFVVITWLTIFFASAQTKSISGVVSSKEGPIPGAVVKLKGKNKAIITDFDGVYNIEAQIGDILIYEYVGYKTQEIVIGKNVTINIKLEIDVTDLNQVVIVGYGSQKRSEVTGAISSVDGDEVKKFATSSFQQALQGKVAGVTILDSGGEPGEGPIVQIRGVNTISSNRAGTFPGDPNLNQQNPTTSGLTPLYVVDGVPFDNNPNISPNNIESIEVLKDAATTAIYGTRAAAGVILIQTRRGQKGKTAIDFTTYTGFDRVTSKVDVVNTREAFLIHRTIHDNNTPDQRYFSILQRNRNALRYDVDWQDFVIRETAQLTNANLRISGAGKDINYNLSLDNFNQAGKFRNSKYERTILRGNAGFNKGKLNVWSSMNVSFGKRQLAPWGLLGDALVLAPYTRPFEIGKTNIIAPFGLGTDGTVNETFDAPIGNLARKFAQDNRRDEFAFGSNIGITYSIFKNLKAKLNLGGSRTTNFSRFFQPKQEVFSEFTGLIDESRTQEASIQNYNTAYQSFLREFTLDYDKFFGPHRVGILIGASAEERTWEELRVEGNTFLSPDQKTITNAAITSRSEQNVFPTTSTGFLGRLKYEYDKKYLLLANARRDGSSKFAPENRIGYFWGISGGWVASKESFIADSESSILANISNLKLRASYGRVGNDRIGDFLFLSPLGSNQNPVFNGGSELGASRTGIGNKDLKWETSITQNYGLDLGLFNGAFSLNADYYIVDKEDLLFGIPTPPSGGVNGGTIVVNSGELRNKGLELAASYQNRKKAFKWGVTGTYTQNDNEVLTLSGTSTDLIEGGSPIPFNNSVVPTPVTFIRPGFSAGAFFLIPTNGIITNEEDLEAYQGEVSNVLGKRSNEIKLGDVRFVDRLTEDNLKPIVDTNGQPVLDADGNVQFEAGQDGVLDSGDGVINDDDRVFAGNNIPDFEVGLNFNAEFKNFDFSMQWFGSFGHKVFNGPKNLTYAFASHRDIAYQFSAANLNSTIAAARTNGTRDPNVSSASDLFLEDGDFVRLRSIQLGYSLPNKVLKNVGITKCRIYVSAQNLLTITDYSGFDPEVGGDGLATRGLDVGNQPVSARGIFGLELSF